jgi:hypothetical protein
MSLCLCRFLVPRQQEQQLVGLLQLLEQQSGGSSSSTVQAQPALGCIADVQLSLTSLEEVFLNIAKQVSSGVEPCCQTMTTPL